MEKSTSFLANIIVLALGCLYYETVETFYLLQNGYFVRRDASDDANQSFDANDDANDSMDANDDANDCMDADPFEDLFLEEITLLDIVLNPNPRVSIIWVCPNVSILHKKDHLFQIFNHLLEREKQGFEPVFSGIMVNHISYLECKIRIVDGIFVPNPFVIHEAVEYLFHIISNLDKSFKVLNFEIMSYQFETVLQYHSFEN